MASPKLYLHRISKFPGCDIEKMFFLFRIAANGWIGTHNILYRSNTRNAMIEYTYTNNSKLTCMNMNMNNVIGLIIMEQTMQNDMQYSW